MLARGPVPRRERSDGAATGRGASWAISLPGELIVVCPRFSPFFVLFSINRLFPNWTAFGVRHRRLQPQPLCTNKLLFRGRP